MHFQLSVFLAGMPLHFFLFFEAPFTFAGTLQAPWPQSIVLGYIQSSSVCTKHTLSVIVHEALPQAV